RVNGGGVVAALVAHHQRGLAGEGREFHLAVDAVGNMARQRGLAGAGIAEQLEPRRRAVLAGLCLHPVGNGFQRGILMRRKRGHGISVEGRPQLGCDDSLTAKLTIRTPDTSAPSAGRNWLALDLRRAGNTLAKTTSRSRVRRQEV